MFYGDDKFGLEAKLIMNDKIVCEIVAKDQEQGNCKWQHNKNTFTFTLKNPGDLHKNEFSCKITKIFPLPIQSFEGPKTRLFRGKFTLFEQHSTVMYLYSEIVYLTGYTNVIFHKQPLNK